MFKNTYKLILAVFFFHFLIISCSKPENEKSEENVNQPGEIFQKYGSYNQKGLATSVYSIDFDKSGGLFVSATPLRKDYFSHYDLNGKWDTTFQYLALNDIVKVVKVQSDGKILLGGNFTSLSNNNVIANRLVRLNANGTIDNTFNIGSGFNRDVNAIEIQNDGKILVAGHFTTFNNTSLNFPIVRLNNDGSIDNTFEGNKGRISYYPEMKCMKLLNDGKIIIGGRFEINDNDKNLKYSGYSRLNTDGSLDVSFLSYGDTYYDNWISGINNIEILPNGKMIMVGDFILKRYNKPVINDIIFVNIDGTLDYSFKSEIGSDGNINSLAILNNGKIIIGGKFMNYNGKKKNNIACLEINGDLNEEFKTGLGFDEEVRVVKKMPDETLLIGGDFLIYDEDGGSSKMIRLKGF